MNAGIAALLLLAACAPAAPGRAASARRVDEATSGFDAGPLRLCLRKAKDPSPCATECDRGIGEACSILAGRLESGEGIPRDASRAVVMHERACDLREPGACVFAARLHATGRGVVPNRSRQIELLAQACTQGEATACAIPAKAYATGTGVAENARRARELLEHACTAGEATSCDALTDAGP